MTTINIKLTINIKKIMNEVFNEYDNIIHCIIADYGVRNDIILIENEKYNVEYKNNEVNVLQSEIKETKEKTYNLFLDMG